MIISFTNVIGAIRSLGEAAQVITTNLKMWLGFETSETLGREKVVNGDFATDSDWTEGAGWDIDEANNRITRTAQSGSTSASQNISFVSGKSYSITYTLDVSAGSFLIRLGGDGVLDTTERSVSDTYTEVVTASGNYTTLNLRALDGTFAGFISNVSVRELTQITPDKSGNNNVGELFTGKALDFDGDGDEIDVSGFQMSGTSATFAFWIYPRDTSYQFIMDNKLASGNTDRTILALYQTGSESQKFGFFNYGFKQFGTPTQNQWQRVVFRVNATTVECYVDGVKSGSTLALTSSIDLSASVTANIASKSGSGSASNLDAKLSDFQIYNAYWSTDDIAYDYANPQNLVTDRSGTSIGLSNLKAYWAMSEGKGLTAYDSGTKLGTEEIVDGDFPTGTTAWTKGSDTTIGNNEASFDGTASYVSQNILVIGKVYECSVRVKTWVSGAALAVGTAATGGGTVYKEITRANNTTTTFTFTAVATTLGVGSKSFDVEGSIDLVSVKEVISSNNNGTINGAIYEPAQPRIPQLGMMNWSKGSNLVKYSEDFSQSVWTKNNLTQTYGSTSPTGLLNATKLRRTSTNSYIESTINITTVQYNTASIYVKGVSSTIGEDVRLYVFNGTSTSNEVFTLTGDWQRITHTNSSASGQSSIKIKLDVPNVTNGEVLVWGGQLEESSSASAYRLTDGAATKNSTVIPNPTIPTKDIFGNLVQNRLNSFNLDGSGYAEVAEVVGLDVTDFSIEAWVKFDYTDSDSSTNVIYVNGGVSTSLNTFALATDRDNKVRFIVGGVTLYSTTVFSNNNWVHIAGTRESGALKLYINGNKTPEATGTGSAVVNNTSDLLIGRDTQTNRFYKERISDVRLYGKALSADEVKNNYDAGLSAHTN